MDSEDLWYILIQPFWHQSGVGEDAGQAHLQRVSCDMM